MSILKLCHGNLVWILIYLLNFTLRIKLGSVFCRVQQESVDDAERNHFLVNYVDYAFDDFGGRQPPVYPGLSTVWGSLARSKVSNVHYQFIMIFTTSTINPPYHFV